jgi:hypothetical protein
MSHIHLGSLDLVDDGGQPSPAAAVLLRTARHGGHVVACGIERGRDMPADKPGGAGHKSLHVNAKPIGRPSLTGNNYPPVPH